MIKTDNVFCLTENQTKIINDLINEFNIKNVEAEPSEFSFFDELLKQSETDKQTIADLQRKKEIINNERKKALHADVNTLSPYIQKCGLALKVENGCVILISDTTSSSNSIRLTYQLKEKRIVLPSGLVAFDCLGFDIRFWLLREYVEENLEAILNNEAFKEQFRYMYNHKK